MILACGCSSAVSGAAPIEDSPSELAASLARKARRAEKAGDRDQAYVFYSQASALQPHNRSYRSHMASLQAGGASSSGVLKSQGSTQTVSAPSTPGAASNPDAEHPVLPAGFQFESLAAREYAGERQLASPPTLAAAPGRFDFDLNDNPRALFDKVSARFNLQDVFDGDYPQGGAPVRFRLSNLDYREALDALQAATGSFVVPISSKAFMVARDTPAKRNDLEQYVALTIRVPQVMTTQELTEIVQVVRQATNVEKIAWDTVNNQIVIRDRISRAAPAQVLLEQLMSYQPQVMIEVQLLEVKDTDLLSYGLAFTNSFSAIYLGGILRNVPNIPAGITQLLTFGGGLTLFGVTVPAVQAMFNDTTSNSRSLFSAQLRSGNGGSGTLHVGDKYPVITSGFIGIPASGNGSGFAAPPAISYENLGLELKATPRIHGTEEVTMTIDATYEVLSGQSANGIPIINRRQINTDIRLRNEEWAVVAGLTGKLDSKSVSGVAGLSHIPLFGHLFKTTTLDEETINLLVGIRPHILSLTPDENVTHPLRVGTEARPYTPL
jgi:type II secretory pathway component GspD/PulD (secretin)